MDCSSREPSRSRLDRGGLRLGALMLALIGYGCGDASRIELPDPTGDRGSDRAALADAFEQVPAGGTVSFGAGTYLIGGERLTLTTPGVSLVGHADGTTLLGCTEDEIDVGTTRDFDTNCDGIRLGAEAQRVSGLRFESFDMSLDIEHVERSDRTVSFTGGQVVEGNSFLNSASLQITVDADSTVLIRGNEFRNTWHALAILGRNVHVLDNDISTPEPELVPMGYPGGAVGISPGPTGVCDSVLVEGNRIDGHSEAVMIATLPMVPGSVCSGITVRNNEITVRTIRIPADPRSAIFPTRTSLAPSFSPYRFGWSILSVSSRRASRSVGKPGLPKAAGPRPLRSPVSRGSWWRRIGSPERSDWESSSSAWTTAASSATRSRFDPRPPLRRGRVSSSVATWVPVSGWYSA